MAKKFGSQIFDVVPHWGAAVGNVQTYVNAGGTLRLGYGISGFPVTVIRPANTGVGRPGPFEAYLFVGGDVRGVAHNIFLDGNTSQRTRSGYRPQASSGTGKQA